MKRGTIAATAAAALALVGTSALGGTASAAPNANAAAKASTAKVAASKWGSYIVVMKGDPLASTFEQKDLGSAKAKKARAKIASEHSAAMKKAGVASSKKTHDYTNTVNGFSVVVSHDQAEKLAKDPNVLRVMPDVLRQKESLGAAAGSDQIKDAEGQTLQQFLGVDQTDLKGDGELLGVIDTGIWPEHPSFADDGTYPAVTLPDVPGHPACDFGNTAANPDDAAWTCNNKLVGAREMLATYRAVIGVLPGEFDSARDDDGHGTHTASTAAGDANVRAWIYDKNRTVDHTSGVAPRAQIVAYKALGSLGGFSSDLAAAIDQAVEDGVDVINYSIGGGPGLTSADAFAFLFANRAGVHVATSAGNSGPGDATIGGPADLPWVTTVGASTQPRFYGGTVELYSDGKVVGAVKGASVTLTSAKLPLIDAAAYFNPLCLSKQQLIDGYVGQGLKAGEAQGRGSHDWARFAAAAKGSMVLCWRGAIGRSEKSLYVLEAGGKAMVLSNQNDTDNYFTDNFRVPTVMVDKSEGDLVAAHAETKRPEAKIVDTANIDTFAPAPSMAVFSSRGPNPSAPSIIKPDITAPGVQVLAGASPKSADDAYEPGQLFQAIAGTSMSSPVMAGMFLLVDEQHPDWSPAAVKSAVMTTAYQDVVDNDRVTPAQPFDFGAGHVSAPTKAVNPGLVFDAGFSDFLGFYCGTPARNDVFADPAKTCAGLASAGIATTVEDLNYPTIGVASLAGSKTVRRTVTNVSGSAATFTASVENPRGMEISVSPSTLSLAAGESAPFEVTIANVSAPFNTDWVFGAVTWSGAGTEVRSNVAAYATPFEAPTSITGSGTDGSVSIPVKVGFDGTYVPEPAGLAANQPLTGSVSQDPDQTFAGCQDQPGTTAVPITVASGAAYLRIAYVLATEDDIDLYLCHGGQVVAQSTAGGTNELIELSQPEAGDYTLYVHGWQVVAPPLDFSIDSWQVVRGQGGLEVTPTSADVSTGDTVDLTASWSGAPSGISYGVVDHTKDGVTYGQTVIQVNN